jgi:hypothetical protein
MNPELEELGVAAQTIDYGARVRHEPRRTCPSCDQSLGNGVDDKIRSPVGVESDRRVECHSQETRRWLPERLSTDIIETPFESVASRTKRAPEPVTTHGSDLPEIIAIWPGVP